MALEFAYQQAFTDNFGFVGNYTYADGKQTSDVQPTLTGRPAMIAWWAPRRTPTTCSGYFENKIFSARVAYTYRSAFYSGLDRSTAFTQDTIGTLVGIAGLHHERSFLDHVRWHELEQSDAQVLRA